MAAKTLKGNNSGSSANPIDLTVPDVKSMLAISTSDVSGLGSAATHPASDFEASGAASSAISAHLAASDPHLQYYTDSRGDARYVPTAPTTVGINATADTTNRLSLKSDASLFDNAGAGHQQKINKAAAGNTENQLFQTGYSGRAEVGLTGDDDFHFKVSPDGTTWFEGITLDSTSGRVDFPSTGVGHNRVINPSGQFAQAGLALTAVQAYSGSDQWYVLTQSNPVTPSQLTNVLGNTNFNNLGWGICVLATQVNSISLPLPNPMRTSRRSRNRACTSTTTSPRGR